MKSGRGSSVFYAQMEQTQQPQTKICKYCLTIKPLNEFRRRTGKRAAAGSRRGACRDCRKKMAAAQAPEPVGTAPHHTAQSGAPIKPYLPEGQGVLRFAVSADVSESSGSPGPQAEVKVSSAANGEQTVHRGRVSRAQRKPAPASAGYVAGGGRIPLPPADAEGLRPMRSGMVWMRGKSDKGRRWQQEIDLELAKLLVREKAAVVINRHTIRRLYTNREFKQYILLRDHYTCRFCGDHGDTIDHLLPRSKGGHTTPVNCVCACNACNQSKADHDIGDFLLKMNQ